MKSKIQSVAVAGQGALGAAMLFIGLVLGLNIQEIIAMPVNVAIFLVVVLVAGLYVLHGWMFAANAYAAIAENTDLPEITGDEVSD